MGLEQDYHINNFILHSNLIEKEDTREAFDDALNAFNYLLTQDSLSLKTIALTHDMMLRRLNPRIVGQFRDVNVRVGNRLCPPHERVVALLNDWLIKIHPNVKDLHSALVAHVKFEEIHPFEDGNGRIGRMLLNWHLVKNAQSIAVIDVRDRFLYYKWFGKEKLSKKDYSFLLKK